MRIAFVHHLPNAGGVTRFSHALIDGLLAADADVSIDYFVSDLLVRSGRVPAFDERRVRVIPIGDPRAVDSPLDEPRRPDDVDQSVVRRTSRALNGHRRTHAAVRAGYRGARAAWWQVSRREVGRHWYEFTLPDQVVDDLAAHDLVYLPFPNWIEPAAIDAPVVATFHDVNHKHFPENFGGNVPLLDRQLWGWTRRADRCVVSTRFIENELTLHYPAAAERTAVVYVAPYNVVDITEEARQAVLARLGLGDAGYLVYPAGNSHHKNLLALVAAADVLKRRHGSLAYPVIFTGFGTDGIGADVWPQFAELDAFLRESSLTLGDDVRGLGFVTDEEVDALTRSARLVVSTSLYEAGCGPALDAWRFGVPVAFSDIPPFVEQLQALGVEARVFYPHDPRAIAAVVEEATGPGRDELLAMAARSAVAISRYTWREAAEGYLAAFEEAIARHRAPGDTQPDPPRHDAGA